MGETYSALRRGWMQANQSRKEGGFLFVFSLVDRQTFDELRSFKEELMDLYHNDPPPSVLVANKADIESQSWVVAEDEIHQLRGSWQNCQKVVYTSARSDHNVNDAFESLCLAIRERAAQHRRRPREGAAREGAAQTNAVASRPHPL